MKLEILGSGCPKCLKMEALVREVVTKYNLDAEIFHFSDLNKIVGYGVMMTPALVVDGKVKITGRLPSESELLKLLK